MRKRSTGKDNVPSAASDAPPNKNSFQRNEILQSAAALFAQKGFGATKLHEVAGAVGLSRTAFYYYFPSKDELLTALVEESTFTLQRRLTDVAQRTDIAPPDMLRTIVADYGGWILNHPTEFRFVSRTENELPPAMAATHNRAKRQLLDSFIGVVRQGIDQGYFKVADARIAALSVIGMCNWSAWWFRPTGALSAAEVSGTLVEYAMRMVQAETRPRSKRERVRMEVESLRESIARLEGLLASES
ncbi:MAG: TetR family regulatory protein [Rhodospirillales bacterium]|nr:TetR family regulatory protein [Rhodospirillales bacterium]